MIPRLRSALRLVGSPAHRPADGVVVAALVMILVVTMALAMQHRMSELGEKWFAEGIQVPFRIRIGINTGVASVGDFGSEGRTTYSAIGNQINLTARIQAQCQPGKVLISHTTWALVQDQILCEERGEIEVKGLHYPVRVDEVVGEASHETAMRDLPDAHNI